MTFLYRSEPIRGAIWQRMFAEHLPDLPFSLWPDTGDKADVTYLGAWTLPDDLSEFTNLKVLFSVAAGVDQLDVGRIPEHVDLVRMLEPGLTAGMVEYVTMAVLALHRGMPAYLDHQRRRVWQPAAAARDRAGWASWASACSGAPCCLRWRRSGFRCGAGAVASARSTGSSVSPARMHCRISSVAATS